MKTDRHQNRKRAGFTLSEVLITVAIITILLAVAIPSVIALRGRLKMMELDDTAREIFLAAQNTLTARKAAGTLDAPAGELGAEDGLYWLDQTDADYLLPTGAIEGVAAGNHYEVLYNAKTATVLEVYYAESPLPAGLHDGGYSNAAADGPALRRSEKIGYYNGEDLELNDVVQILPPLGDLLINEEELYVNITLPKSLALTYFKAGVILSVTIEALDGSGSVEFSDITYYSEVNDSSDPDYVTVKLILDSLNGPKFQERCRGLTPGADIRATARLTGPNENWLPAEISDEDNSLFAGRNGGDVSIAYPRHLQNLEPSFSNLDWLYEPPVGKTAPTVYVTAAHQDANIEWPADHAFVSIDNPKLNSYNGNSLEIKDLRGTNGLFETFTGEFLKDICIVDPHINGSSANIGALAGKAFSKNGSGSTDDSSLLISGCRVYAIPKSDYRDIGVVGLAGYTGGLIGQAQKCLISNTFSALPTVSGTANNVGGLIGQTSNCKITNSYAVVDDLIGGNGFTGMFVGQGDAGSKIDHCYATGNLSAGYYLYGFASGNANITNSYCAVTYEKPDGSKGQPAFGFAQGTVSNCAYLGTGISGLPDKELETSYLEMTAPGWTPGGGSWIDIPASQSHPYRQELFGKTYPFPGLRTTISRIPHYGSWPVQLVDAILAFPEKANPDPEEPEKTVDYLVCPTGGSISFWAEPRNGSTPVDLRVDEPSTAFAFTGSTAGLTAERGDPVSDTPRTQIILTGKAPGVYAVEVTAGGAKLWVPVIVCSAEMTLTATDEDDLTAVNSATLLDGQPNSTVLPLRTTKRAKFTATMAVTGLDAETAAAGMEALYAAASGANAPVSTGNSPLTITAEDWLGFRVMQDGKMVQYGPGVSLNEEVANGVYRLQPVDGKPLFRAGTNGPAPGTSDTLTVTGQSAGMATVSVCWAMDSRLNVNGHIEVSGTQAFIYSASASGDINGALGSKDNFPYLLDIKPMPKEAVTLSFTGWLSSRAPDNATQTWTWTIKDVNTGKTVGSLKETFKPDELPFGTLPKHNFVVPLNDTAAHARYEVQMVYSYTTGNSTYTTSDFMYITVIRTTLHTGDDDHSTLTVFPTSLSLEQINWGDEGVKAPPGHETENLKIGEVRGTVSQAADTQLLWYLKEDAYNSRKILTGMDRNDPVVVFGPGDLPIAKLLWTAGGVDDPPGGVVTVEAMNCDYYGDTPLTFYLLAQARDNGDAADYKEVPVNIMPRLKINPQSAVVIGKKATSYTFTANRQDSIHTNAKWDDDGMKATTTPGQPYKLVVPITEPNNFERYTLTYTYGPYTAKAQLGIKPFSKEIETSISCDIEVDGTPYVLVQKGITQPLTLSWAGKNNGSKIKVIKEPSSITVDDKPILTIKKDDAHSTTGESITGSCLYDLTGNEFSHKALPLTWELDGNNVSASGPIIYNVYVVGTEFTKDETSIDQISLSDLGASDTISISSYFPTELKLGAGTITITSSNEKIISLSENTFTPDGKPHEITLTGKNYGTTVLTATYKVGDYIYKDTCKVTVQAPGQQIHTVLEPCTTDEDRAALAKLFKIGPDDDLMTYAEYDVTELDDNGKEVSKRAFLPTLLTGRDAQSENFFGHNVLYLKAYITDRDGGDALPLTNYVDDMAIFSDNPALIDIYSGHTASADGDPRVFYLKVVARPGMGTLSGDDVTISAQFGSLKAKELPIKVFSEPSVRILWETEMFPQVSMGDDVTNGHTVIQGFDKDTKLRSYHFHAELYPWLQKRVVNEDGGVTYTKLDDLIWFLKFPSGAYAAGNFIDLKPANPETPNTVIGPECNAVINASPSCKVAITVQSKKAYDAKRADLTISAHALVFIPNETTRKN